MSLLPADSGTYAANGTSTMQAKRSQLLRPALALLAFMMARTPSGDIEYTPAMPALRALQTGYGLVQLSMTFYLAARGQPARPGLCWPIATDGVR